MPMGSPTKESERDPAPIFGSSRKLFDSGQQQRNRSPMSARAVLHNPEP